MNIIATEIGYFGPAILLLILILKIKHKYKFFYIILFVIVNESSNRILKYLIKQPRPTGIKYINTWDTHTAESYGMPSGHSQNATAATIFLILYTKNPLLAVYAILQTLLTMYQRYCYKKHTTNQIICGGIIGIIMGSLYYVIFNNISVENAVAHLQTIANSSVSNENS